MDGSVDCWLQCGIRYYSYVDFEVSFRAFFVCSALFLPVLQCRLLDENPSTIESVLIMDRGDYRATPLDQRDLKMLRILKSFEW